MNDVLVFILTVFALANAVISLMLVKELMNPPPPPPAPDYATTTPRNQG